MAESASVIDCGGTVALGVNDAEPASIGAVTERQFHGAHVFTMHFNTGFSVHLMPSVGWRGSMQQSPHASVAAAYRSDQCFVPLGAGAPETTEDQPFGGGPRETPTS